MAQCKQTAQEFIQEALAPSVAVLCSHDAQLLCQKNNLTMVEMMQPFCRLTSEGRNLTERVGMSNLGRVLEADRPVLLICVENTPIEALTGVSTFRQCCV